MSNMQDNKQSNPQGNKSASTQGSQNSPEATKKLAGEVSKTWSKLTPEEAALHATDREKFCAKVQEKHGDSADATKKKMGELEKSCGCTSSTSGAKAA